MNASAQKPWLAFFAALSALAAGVAASGGLSWQADWAKALDQARKESRPLLVVVLDRLTADPSQAQSLDRLERNASFAKAAPLAVLVRVQSATGDMKKAFGIVEAETPLAFIAFPDGRVVTAYASLPSPAAVAKDIRAAAAQLQISRAEAAAAEGDDAVAITLLRTVISENPPYGQARAARIALDDAAERGKAKVAQADALAAKHEYAAAGAAFEKIAADYAGTDAGSAAAERLRGIASNPAAARAVQAEKEGAAAAEILVQARSAEEGKRLAEAAQLYQRILKEYKDSPAATDASAGFDRVGKGAEEEAKERRQQTERDCALWMSYGDSLAQLGKAEKARGYYQKIIDTYPESGYAETARAKLKGL
jgi:tetratricopeptide (TPR) repeat protein